MDFIYNMPNKPVWWELKDSYKSLLREEWQKMLYLVKEEAKVKNQLKFMIILKD